MPLQDTKTLAGRSNFEPGGVIGTESVESETVTNAAVDGIPRSAEGVELIGEYQGAGFQESRYILPRPTDKLFRLDADHRPAGSARLSPARWR